ncbi:hypothetical protein JS569_27265, partial [Klebsiella pneumoniae]|uniref:hypothetical protein n=1 Tax=Klebsiella pneumoniae TaxID=573 RepID=UPI00195110F1
GGAQQINKKPRGNLVKRRLGPGINQKTAQKEKNLIKKKPKNPHNPPGLPNTPPRKKKMTGVEKHTRHVGFTPPRQPT